MIQTTDASFERIGLKGRFYRVNEKKITKTLIGPSSHNVYGFSSFSIGLILAMIQTISASLKESDKIC